MTRANEYAITFAHWASNESLHEVERLAIGKEFKGSVTSNLKGGYICRKHRRIAR